MQPVITNEALKSEFHLAQRKWSRSYEMAVTSLDLPPPSQRLDGETFLLSNLIKDKIGQIVKMTTNALISHAKFV
jgi:hypothetical protein